MRKIGLVIVLLILSLVSNAQDGFTFLGLRSGWVADKGVTTTVNLDFSSHYFSSYELFAEFYRNYNTSYKSMMGGVVYKPALIRNKNTLMKMRFGLGAGVGREEFLLAPQLGWEFSQTVYKNVDILFVNRNQYVLFDQKPDQWRIGFDIGLRLPL
jgi:hypothetical protein